MPEDERRTIGLFRRHASDGEPLAVAIDREGREVLVEQGPAQVAAVAADARSVRGQGDADAAAIYASAYNKDPEFFSFGKLQKSWVSLKIFTVLLQLIN